MNSLTHEPNQIELLPDQNKFLNPPISYPRQGQLKPTHQVQTTVAPPHTCTLSSTPDPALVPNTFVPQDPFHFGSVGRAMFAVWQFETLDNWDQILFTAMYGCDRFASGYPFTSGVPGLECRTPRPMGWLGGGIILFVTLAGAYVLPTVLIVLVTISFDQAQKQMESKRIMRQDMMRVASQVNVELPDFFSPDRVHAIRKAFLAMDAKFDYTLDLTELSPFFFYAFDKLFHVRAARGATQGSGRVCECVCGCVRVRVGEDIERTGTEMIHPHFFPVSKPTLF